MYLCKLWYWKKTLCQCIEYFTYLIDAGGMYICVNFINALVVMVSVVTQARTLTLIEGDGIGPEISNAVIKIFAAADVSYLSV